ncbi:MAG: processing peptidase [Candidatus Gottesmanbacteria bacterium GW2011_GWA2_43_14]|uniref:Processing peptidase n=1 Tax=Candidatus Gottesmanbacteria bacterium GW2011_GWA2_43_14 TaxID=1618443 RepID=A0A0G1FRT2_9BACT|nr:MAG: processing peptidase [Candidatus Gottesmanbacteria bacterium GW2011_GWA2_43_14]
MKYNRTKLNNGSSLAVIQIPHSTSVTISAYIKAGYRYDPINKPGLAHFTEHMLFTGTKKYPSHSRLAYEIERYGGFHMAFTWIDYQNHFIRFPRDQFHLGIEILLDTLFHSLILREEVEKEKGTVKEEILRNISDPEKAVWSYVFLPLFFKSTSLSRPYSGMTTDVGKFTREDVYQFTRSHFQPENVVYLITGNVKLYEAEQTINKYLKKYSFELKRPIESTIKRKIDHRVSVKFYESDSISLIVAIPTVSIYSSDRHALEILRNMLSRDFGASLPDKLRNQGGLIYTWSSSHDNLFDTGYLLFKTAANKKNIIKVIHIIIEEFQRIAQGEIQDEEIETAKGNLVGRILTNIETGSDYIHWYGLQEFYTLNKILHIPDQIDIYKHITKKDILTVAKRYFTIDKIYIAACGDVRKRELEKLLI